VTVEVIVAVAVIVTMTMVVTVTMAVIVADILVVTVGLHLYFRVVGWGKDRCSYPPSGWSLRTQGVVSSFWFDPDNLGSCIFL